MATTSSLPTDEEVARHNETHLPFRAWCKVCVQGKARQSGHKARPVEVTERTLVQVDHCHMTCDDIAGKPKLTMFVAVENRHGEVLSLLIRKKGSSDEYNVKRICCVVGRARERASHCEVRCGARHWRRRERGSVQKGGKDRAAAVTEEIKRGTRSCRGNELHCEAWAACQVPVGESQRRKQAGGVDGETLRVAPQSVLNEGHWQNGVLLKDGQRIQTRDR